MLLKGQCLCGGVRYECSTEPLTMKYCHCDTCRRVTGSAFNIGVGVPADDLKVIGKIQSYTHTNGSTREFCPVCGSPLFTRSPHIVWIRAGSLDSSDGLQPAAEMWTEMAVPWSRIPDNIPSYPHASPSTSMKK